MPVKTNLEKNYNHDIELTHASTPELEDVLDVNNLEDLFQNTQVFLNLFRAQANKIKK